MKRASNDTLAGRRYLNLQREAKRTGRPTDEFIQLYASWEGYAVEEVLSQLQPDQPYFWATHQGAELDLLLFKDGRRLGIEIKRADAPTVTASMAQRSMLCSRRSDGCAPRPKWFSATASDRPGR